jgi:hypothetical protein
MNAAAYNAYLDSYLGLVDKLDDTTQAQVGPEYAFLFKYIYPRVQELRKPDPASQAANGVVHDPAYPSITKSLLTPATAWKEMLEW